MLPSRSVQTRYSRRQRRFRQLLEKTGEEQQGDQRQRGHHQTTDLRPRARAAVHRGLGETAVDHHSRAQTRSQVRRAQSDQLAIRRYPVARSDRVRLRCAQPLGEPDDQDADRRAAQFQVAGQAAGIRQTEIR
jgi:hypothetical protein